MNTPNKLQELEEFASALLDNRSLDIIMQYPSGTVEEGIIVGNEIGITVLRGRLKTEARLRKAVIEMAITGSNTAQAMAKKMLDEVKISNI